MSKNIALNSQNPEPSNWMIYRRQLLKKNLMNRFMFQVEDKLTEVIGFFAGATMFFGVWAIMGANVILGVLAVIWGIASLIIGFSDKILRSQSVIEIKHYSDNAFLDYYITRNRKSELLDRIIEIFKNENRVTGFDVDFNFALSIWEKAEEVGGAVGESVKSSLLELINSMPTNVVLIEKCNTAMEELSQALLEYIENKENSVEEIESAVGYDAYESLVASAKFVSAEAKFLNSKELL